MVQFSAVLKKFRDKGEKTGWTYIEVPGKITEMLKPGNKRSFRVKGKLDDHSINGVALLPMGGGEFIMAVNGQMRKAIGKRMGAIVKVKLQADDKYEVVPPPDLVECLSDEPFALKFFNSLPKSHRDYFIKWIDSAKTEPTRVKRIAMTVSALSKGSGYGEMLRALKKQKDLG